VLHPKLLAEFRSISSNSRQVMRFWIEKIPENEEDKSEYSQLMTTFFKDFFSELDNNGHLFSEKEDLKITEEKNTKFVMNVFAEKYRSAERLLEIAREIDKPIDLEIKFSETIEAQSVGSIYFSSSILFVISLEALINMVLTLLLKEEFRSRDFERATTLADIDTRLITAHVFCDGFGKQVLEPNSELWDRLLKLRRFRNDSVHGNLTSDHYVYSIDEDLYTFFYYPAIHYRGRSEEKKAYQNHPKVMSQIDQTDVVEIKQTVDDIIHSILSAANDDMRQWLDRWLWKAAVPPFKSFADFDPSQMISEPTSGKTY